MISNHTRMEKKHNFFSCVFLQGNRVIELMLCITHPAPSPHDCVAICNTVVWASCTAQQTPHKACRICVADLQHYCCAASGRVVVLQYKSNTMALSNLVTTIFHAFVPQIGAPSHNFLGGRNATQHFFVVFSCVVEQLYRTTLSQIVTRLCTQVVLPATPCIGRVAFLLPIDDMR